MQAVLKIDRKWLVLAAVGSGTFMSALDGSVVNTVLPVINRSFDSSLATIEWVLTIYLLVVNGLLLSFGRWGDMRGHKSIYVSGFVIFILNSALCGLAPNARTLILFRALQGLGAAMLFANSPAILTKNFPTTQRGQALGFQATMTYLGLTVGPALGGWLTGRFSWRAVFFINVPIGLMALGLSFYFIPGDSPPDHQERFDLAGAFTWICGLVALLLALAQGHAWGWRSGSVFALLIVAGLFLATFVFIERRIPDPMLDLRLFQRRSFSAAAVSAVLNFICAYSIVFLLPFYLIQGRGIGPARTGLLLAAHSLVRAVVAPLSGTLSDRIGSRLPGMVGMGVLGLGLFLMSQLGARSSLSAVVVALAITGLGTGLFISPNNSAIMGSAPPDRQGTAAGVLATARNLGMVLGVGLAGAILTTVIAHHSSGGSVAPLLDAVATGFRVATGVAALGVLTTAAGDNWVVRR